MLDKRTGKLVEKRRFVRIILLLIGLMLLSLALSLTAAAFKAHYLITGGFMLLFFGFMGTLMVFVLSYIFNRARFGDGGK